MPTYLVHGFRWHRPSIRIHIILYDLEDAAPEWIIAPATAATIVSSFYKAFDFLPPHKTTDKANTVNGSGTIGSSLRGTSTSTTSTGGQNSSRADAEAKPKTQRFNDTSPVKLLEQFDPDDLTVASQPYAFVGDFMVDVKLSVDIAAEMTAYEVRARTRTGDAQNKVVNSNGTSSKADSVVEAGIAAPEAGLGENKEVVEVSITSGSDGWIEKLRDQLQKDEKVGWYVIYCGDEDRDDGVEAFVSEDEDEIDNWASDDGGSTPTKVLSPKADPIQRQLSSKDLPNPVSSNPVAEKDDKPTKVPRLRTMKSFFGRKDKGQK